MKIACVRAIADLALAEPSDVVAAAYGDESLVFGPEYLIPKPFDPRLILELAPAVAKAAMESGVATRPISDFEAYRERLTQFVFRSGLVMRPVFEHARAAPKRLVYAEGEDERVLRAAQQVIDDGIASPILIGRREVVERRVKHLNLRLKIGENVELCDPEDDPRFQRYWTLYHQLMERKGVSPDFAKSLVRTRNIDHRRADGPARRGRCADLRHGRPVPPAPEASRRHSRPLRRSPHAVGALGDRAAQGHLVPLRHPCRRRSDRCSRSPR